MMSEKMIVDSFRHTPAILAISVPRVLSNNQTTLTPTDQLNTASKIIARSKLCVR